ncbi:MAG: hypothetical protein J6U93_05355 [Alistipes sp.]|nr:hypothetical protein [Alistipes sp.]
MYQHSITRMSRSAVVIAIDSSISMQEWTMFYHTRMRKMDVATLIANFAIDELVMRSSRSGDMRDYYDIAVLQYSGDGIEPVIADEDNGMIHISALHDRIPQPICYNIVQQTEDGSQSTIPISLHEWITPKAYGIAPMYEVLTHIKSLVSKWCDDPFNRKSFPPMVINITDGCCGDAEDSELLDMASEIQSIGTKDGTTLLLNIYLANEADESDNILFPSVCDLFSHDHDCQLLYNMSSTLPEELEYIIKDLSDCGRQRPYKCFARNASICEILALVDIGTDGCEKYSTPQ